MLAALEPLIASERPDVLLVYGDTNSTLAGALAGAQAGVPVAHVEAGMRSYDRTMPEELNRVAGRPRRRAAAVLVRALGRDAARRARGRRGRRGRRRDGRRGAAARARGRASARRRSTRAASRRAATSLATAHRAGNVDDPARLERLVELLLAVDGPVVLPAASRARARGWRPPGCSSASPRGVRLAPPLGYLDFMALLLHARAVLTDSGGVQKEAYLAGVPCVTLRATTEWTETVDAGWNVLVDLDADAAAAALRALSARRAAGAVRRRSRRRAGRRGAS